MWRYMDLARYLSLLQDSALHFVRADQMRDSWEGSFSPVNQSMRPEMYGEDYEGMFAHAGERRQHILQRMHMNCWYLAEYESAAMWDIYQREGRGVAVRSTWGALTSSVTAERKIYGARVKYADYSQTFIPEGNAFDAFLHKRISFSHEHEVRLLMMTGLTAPHPTEPNTSINLGAEPPVIPIAVNLPELIDRVYIAPDAPAWIADVVTDVTRTYGHEFPVIQSDLASDPIA